VVGPKFEDAEPLSSGLSRIREGDSYGYADKTGSIVVLPQWASADDFNEELAVVGNLEGPVWYIDRSGNPAFPGKFAVASSFFKGLAHVKLLPKDAREARASFAYIDITGRRVFTY